MGRRRRHHGGARGMRANAESDAVGLAVDNAAALIIDTERIGGDLRHDGLKALAERGAASDDLNHPGLVDEILPTIGRTEPALSHKHRAADADKSARLLTLFHIGVESI